MRNLGINPNNGGSPPKDNKRRGNKILSVEEEGISEGISFGVYMFV